MIFYYTTIAYDDAPNSIEVGRRKKQVEKRFLYITRVWLKSETHVPLLKICAKNNFFTSDIMLFTIWNKIHFLNGNTQNLQYHLKIAIYLKTFANGKDMRVVDRIQ